VGAAGAKAPAPVCAQVPGPPMRLRGRNKATTTGESEGRAEWRGDDITN
jgi:hypothetical protein